MEPLHDALAHAYVRLRYVPAAMFTDMVAGRAPGTIRHYLDAAGFDTGERR